MVAKETPWACYISASIFLTKPTKESLSLIHRCESIQGRLFVSHSKSVEWRQWDFWLRFLGFNYVHFPHRWAVLRWASLNQVSAFISCWKPASSEPPSKPWACCRVSFENRDGDRTALELIAFKYYFYLWKNKRAVPSSFVPPTAQGPSQLFTGKLAGCLRWPLPPLVC